MLKALLLVVSLLFVPLVAFSRLSPAWIDTPAHAPNIRMLMHETGANKNSAESSFVAVQLHTTNDERIKKLIVELKTKQAPITEFLPHRCFELSRKELTSRQIWCEGKANTIFAFIESGPIKMKENERTHLLFGVLEDAK